MIFRTKRLQLRELQQSDFRDLAEILQDSLVTHMYAHAFTEKDVQEWLDRQRKRYRESGLGLWAMILQDTGAMIGQAGLTLQPYKNTRIPEIGYLLKKEYREISAEEWDWFYEQVMRALYYHPEGGSRAMKRALRLYGECADAAWERMTAGRRLLCRYVYGISPEHGRR